MAILVNIILYGAAVFVVAYVIARFYLRGHDLSAHDAAIPVTFDSPTPSEAAIGVDQYIIERMSKPETLEATRQRFTEMGLSRQFDCTFISQSAEFDGLSVPGEWTVFEGADPSKRLYYIHGGAFMLGSPISHRPIIANIAKRTGCVVFAPDYRLMPENKRKASILDSRAAYQWMLENGPHGPAIADKVAVAGDSAGGNLTLCLINWVRDTGLRMPDAVVALSPAADGTASGPSIRSNLETDHMLRRLATPMLKVPTWLLMWIIWATNRIVPSSTLISPLHDDLGGLPPTLIHASTAEILYDDAKRYTNKAVAQGSPVTLQTWPHLCHVWQMFDEALPEANHAFDEIAAFMHQHGVTKQQNPNPPAAD